MKKVFHSGTATHLGSCILVSSLGVGAALQISTRQLEKEKKKLLKQRNLLVQCTVHTKMKTEANLG